MLIAQCIGSIESQRESAAVSHISRKTSEMWGTRPSSGNQLLRSRRGGAASPVVDGIADGSGGQVAAAHFVFGNTAQGLGYRCLSDPISLVYRFAQHHLRGHRRTGDGYRAAHALEFHFLDDVVFDAQRNQDRVAVERALYH